MNVTTLAPPAVEPVGLAEAKEYLRIAYDGEDVLVAQLVAAARARIEQEAGLALIARSLRVTLDCWPSGTMETRALRLPVRPGGDLVAVRVRDREGIQANVTSRFVLEAGRAARLVWTNGAFPWSARGPGAVEIDYTAGFGEAPEDVSEALRLAVKRLAAMAYHARDVEMMSVALPDDVRSQLAPWRRVRL